VFKANRYNEGAGGRVKGAAAAKRPLDAPKGPSQMSAGATF
jgi:hypothetical protein